MPRAAKVRAPRGASAGSVLAVIVLAVLVLAIGYLLGRASSDENGSAMDVAGLPSLPAPAGGGTAAPPAGAVPAATAAPETAPPPAPVPGPGGAAAMRSDPPVAFEPAVLDFGLVPPDTQMRGTVSVRNMGGEPLTLTAMRPSCKCTTLEDLDGTVIDPGAAVQVTALFDAGSMSGAKNSRIRFVFAGYRPAEVVLRSIVGRALRPTPSVINAIGASFGEVLIEARDGQPFHVLSVNGRPPQYVPGREPKGQAPQSSCRLRWDLRGYDPATCVDAGGHPMPKWWVVETDHPLSPLIELPVRHPLCTLAAPVGRDGWYLAPRRVMLGDVAPGGSVEFDVTRKWLRNTSAREPILEVRTNSQRFQAMLLGVSDGDPVTCRVRITAGTVAPGLLLGEVLFIGGQTGGSYPVTVIGRVVAEGVG